ncbi:relaxase/mobilization nuclease domain-containing protein [[Clostridium] polysaccharolyticum]|uniref:Relaxase/Mobilisation nuclease domain-containing protein n=1 Tax=[Clostridium] polysaccharolyticum TaxID=29364 RepID=A0A1H9Y881_9FIRM|nr:relaxase/mobilization nuclease domain-containing protein [[Clostridium] polysaccharolyticum]SES65002.1 Relaxase/Mobilisation nuclease domain-containing protein [[Clostridium] polysaccharolyticum]
MAIIEFINGKPNKNGRKITYKSLASVKRLINYIYREDKTLEHLKGGVYCNPYTAYDEFVLTKSIFNKCPASEGEITENRQAIHLTQSFAPGEGTPELAKQIADEFVKHAEFAGFQIAYAVHIDKAHLHTHFVVNTVNYEDGYMWHKPDDIIPALQRWNDELCKKYGLSITQKKNKERVKSGEYRARKEGRSWKAETLHCGMECAKVAKSKEEYIGLMEKFGYKVRWVDTRKDITYTTPQGKKINSDKLGIKEKNFYPLTKEALEKQFSLNRQVKRNKYISTVQNQEQLKQNLLKFAEKVAKDQAYKNYPFQQQWHSGKLEGEALKERINELKKGQGLDWEQDR